MRTLIVTGSDTSVGKTVVSAMLTLCLGGIYWKPVQAGTEDGTDRQRVAAMTGLGTEDGTDRQRVAAMTGLGPESFRPETYVLKSPLSPHRAAELDGVAIEESALRLPGDIPGGRTLIVEGAGGVLVPVNRALLFADVFAHWGAPAILCARTSLGTINHSLLSLEALRARNIPVLGIVFVGDANEDSETTIAKIGKVKRLGRLPMLSRLNAESLRAAFAENFELADFGQADGG